MFRTYVRSFLIWACFLLNITQGQEFVLTTPSESVEIRSEVGKLVTMTVKDEEIMVAEWVIAVGPEDSFAVSETGKFSYFAVPSQGKYVFVIAYLNPELKLKAKKFIVVAGSPDPDNKPKPQPKLPDGKYKLAQFAYDCCKGLSQDDKKSILKMAKNYSDRSGENFANPQAMVNITRDGNREALKDMDPAKVQALIFEPLTAEFKKLQLKTIEELKDAWSELALGYYAWANE